MAKKVEGRAFHLNTSHVKLQRTKTATGTPNMAYLNTSHVKLQHILIGLLPNGQGDLNTSHVKLQPVQHQYIIDETLFKYISC